MKQSEEAVAASPVPPQRDKAPEGSCLLCGNHRTFAVFTNGSTDPLYPRWVGACEECRAQGCGVSSAPPDVLRKLMKESAAVLALAESELCEAIGNTNLAVFKQRIEEAGAYLDSRAEFAASPVLPKVLRREDVEAGWLATFDRDDWTHIVAFANACVQLAASPVRGAAQRPTGKQDAVVATYGPAVDGRTGEPTMAYSSTPATRGAAPQDWKRFARHRSGCTAWGGDHPQLWRDGDEFACDCGLADLIARSARSAQGGAVPRDTLQQKIRDLEWAGVDEHVHGCCAFCQRFPVEGHESWCGFAELLKLAALHARSSVPQPEEYPIVRVDQVWEDADTRTQRRVRVTGVDLKRQRAAIRNVATNRLSYARLNRFGVDGGYRLVTDASVPVTQEPK